MELKLDRRRGPSISALGQWLTFKRGSGMSASYQERTRSAPGAAGRITGVQSGNWAAYFGGERIEDDAWRQFSPSDIKRMYADLGFKNSDAEFHFNFTGADNFVGVQVQAATPVQLLGLGWGKTFTQGGSTNQLAMESMNGTVKATDTLSFAGVAYYREFNQALTTINDYVGVYFSDTFDVNDRLSLTAGGRYNFAMIQIADETGNFPELNGTNTYVHFNPMAGATYKINPGLSLYGGWSEANGAPVAAELACSDPNSPCLIESFLTSDPSLQQVVSQTWETGLRSTQTYGSNQLQCGLGVFSTENINDIITVFSNVAGRGIFETFAAPVIKIQEERGQRVISTGPYRIVRHPMYAGATLYMIGMPLLLGSWLGLLVLPLIFGTLTVRTFIEEAALRKGLPATHNMPPA
jgi:outer membrane receptor protein involved in Fe transport